MTRVHAVGKQCTAFAATILLCLATGTAENRPFCAERVESMPPKFLTCLRSVALLLWVALFLVAAHVRMKPTAAQRRGRSLLLSISSHLRSRSISLSRVRDGPPRGRVFRPV